MPTFRRTRARRRNHDCSKRCVSHLLLIDKELGQQIFVFVCELVVYLTLSGVTTPCTAPETVFDGVPRTLLRRNNLVKKIYKKNSITCLSPECQPSRPVSPWRRPKPVKIPPALYPFTFLSSTLRSRPATAEFRSLSKTGICGMRFSGTGPYTFLERVALGECRNRLWDGATVNGRVLV